MFRGRAVEKLTRPAWEKWEQYTECPRRPQRPQEGASGCVRQCSSLSGTEYGQHVGRPLSKLVKQYDADSHPICRPLVKGGPALLARECDVPTRINMLMPAICAILFAGR